MEVKNCRLKKQFLTLEGQERSDLPQELYGEISHFLFGINVDTPSACEGKSLQVVHNDQSERDRSGIGFGLSGATEHVLEVCDRVIVASWLGDACAMTVMAPCSREREPISTSCDLRQS